ncbi:MAG TPA: DUF4349 domain-containing protein [Anaerolineales bacterium]|nr:DUF4349 domain-containing protein [Anaerolineales bacterium]
MKSRFVLFTLLVLVPMLVLAACGGAAATQAPTVVEAPASGLDENFSSAGQSVSKSGEGIAAPQPADVAALPAPTLMPAFEISNQSGENVIVQDTNRKIIKNADVRLQVKDTNVAVNRATQIISDLGGYIISSRIWYQDYFGNNLMYASITIGVPVDEFEHALTRLRELAVKVLDETASGEDVTDQYVDLQSQLTNLEATRARIQEFLQDAKTVDEALRINQELANIEAQIEQIKGRMNFISDRSAFSTITINFEPEFPILTATPTTTPRPTSTPIPWKPGDTFNDAKNTVTVAYQGIANFLIWLLVVILPILLPPALIIWVLWKMLNRKPNKPSGGAPS